MKKEQKQPLKIDRSESYEQALRRLRNFLYVQERERQAWSRENWFHEDGRYFRIYRFLMPLLSLCGWLLAALYAGIRMFQTVSEYFSRLTEAECDRITFYSWLIIACIFVSIVCNILILFRKKLKLPSIVLSVSNAVVFFHVLTQINAITFDNTTQGAAFNYSDVCAVLLIVYGVMLLMSCIIGIIVLNDRRQLNALVESTVTKITASSKSITDKEQYCRLIDEWLSRKKEKKSAESSADKSDNSDESEETD